MFRGLKYILQDHLTVFRQPVFFRQAPQQIHYPGQLIPQLRPLDVFEQKLHRLQNDCSLNLAFIQVGDVMQNVLKTRNVRQKIR